jgi:hypothetical protein
MRIVLLVVATVRIVCFNFSSAGLTPTMLSSELRVPASRRSAKFWRLSETLVRERAMASLTSSTNPGLLRI